MEPLLGANPGGVDGINPDRRRWREDRKIAQPRGLASWEPVVSTQIAGCADPAASGRRRARAGVDPFDGPARRESRGRPSRTGVTLASAQTERQYRGPRRNAHILGP